MAKAKRTIQQSPNTGSVKRSEARLVVRSVHVAPRADSWVVVKPGQVTQTFPTKGEAVSFAKSLARDPGGRILVHERNGKIVDQIERASSTQKRQH
ncbi:MAG TPA: DUF2188 domain-containing protein [Thermoanaerobaculia bacterium]|nr:DUF2188 domain-containing protein [Thermoanaerobaculia bacterium]